MSGLVPADLSRNNVTSTKTLVASIIRSNQITANSAITDSITINSATANSITTNSITTNSITANSATIGQLETIPISISVVPDSSEFKLNLSLENNASVYTPALNTVQLQANIFLGNPPAYTEVVTIASIPVEYAPPIDQFVYALVPSYNATPPFDFSTTVGLRLQPNGEITLYMNNLIGYTRFPVQFSYRLAS